MIRTALLVLAAALIAPLSPGRPAGQEPVRVWVNTRSGVYHCPGTTYYGRTSRGEYLAEPEARRRGYRANGGQRCGAAAVVDTAPEPDGGPPPPPDSLLRPCTVARITDGDTIHCDGLGAVRLIGIDSPEQDQPPFDAAATAGLGSLLPLNAAARVELDREPRDQHGRLLAYLWLEGRMVNWAMVRHGWAVTLRLPPNIRYAGRFDAAEARARAEGRGLWRIGGFACRPADHRAGRC